MGVRHRARVMHGKGKGMEKKMKRKEVMNGGVNEGQCQQKFVVEQAHKFTCLPLTRKKKH